MWNIHSEQARKDFPRLEEFLSLLPQNRDYTVFPGFADVHVHLRDAVCAMPNLNPVPDSGEHLEVQEAAIAAGAVIHVYPYGAITVGEQGETLADLAALAPRVCGFSDDGRGVQARAMMEAAMVEAKALGKVIAAHCEDNALLHGGYIHDGQYARIHGHKGICSESEWGPIARDLELAAKTGCKYHVCHISTKESVELIRQAKKSGVDVTCETGPHYLVLDDSCLREDGRFKMNPPLRDRSDREALVEGLRDGTIDMIATDHAPHSAEEKARGLAKSAMGVVGIETAFPVVYTYLVKPGLVPLETVVNALTVNPRTRFGLPLGEDFSVWDLEDRYVIDPETFLSLGRATPFAGMEVQGRNLLTVCGGKAVWQAERS